MNEMYWGSKTELLRDFASPTGAKDELILRACSTNAAVKARARDLLNRYFGLAPTELPCIPCE